MCVCVCVRVDRVSSNTLALRPVQNAAATKRLADTDRTTHVPARHTVPATPVRRVEAATATTSVVSTVSSLMQSCVQQNKFHMTYPSLRTISNG